MTTTTKLLNEFPKITDVVKFELETTDSDGNLIDPYTIDKVTIYFLAREFTTSKDHTFSVNLTESLTTNIFFNSAQPINIFGDSDNAAWLSTSPDDSQLTKVGTGEFELLWTPRFAREGDYIICWTWTPIIAGSQLATYTQFFLFGDTRQNTTTPAHITNPDKYTTLLERYLPEHVKLKLSDDDLTPVTLEKLNLAIADGFNILEDLGNQIVDLQDANALHEQMILYLANNFNLKLRSNDPTLWRRQIKNAIPIFKQKGTLIGLRQAFAQSGIKFNSFDQYWQVVSPYTWQETFTVTGDQVEFELTKSVFDLVDFDLSIRLNEEETYSVLTASEYATITYDDDDCVYLLTWIGDTAPAPIILADGDIIRITYKLQEIADQPTEDYIRSLQLKDKRDEATVTYPLKNWNVYLIKETDALFDTICPNRHPFREPIIYGQVRTEFPYSENAYNTEEYNGSLRNSTNPCDLSKTFLDDCGCCMSSTFDLAVEINDLSSNRINEAEDIINEYKPFHSTLNQMDMMGGINEILPPQEESVEVLIQMNINESVVNGNDAFTRVIEDGLIDPTAVKRGVLASVIATTSGTGIATNDAISLYSPNYYLDKHSSGLNESSNLLDILSGPNTGKYSLINSINTRADIVQSPDVISGYPLDTNELNFRLFNILYNGTIPSITQANIFKFSDPNNNLRLLGATTNWVVEVSGPSLVIGTYVVSNTYPDGSVELPTWPSAASGNNITYQLKDDLGNVIISSSTTGENYTVLRAKVTGNFDFISKRQVSIGHHLVYNNVLFKIIEIIDAESFYILHWTLGTMGTTSVKIVNCLTENTLGYLDGRGMTLDTTPNDYEALLSISNGANNLGPLLENNQLKESFLILMYGEYFSISEIDGTTVTLSGPKKVWGTSGIPVAFSFVQFDKLQHTIQNKNLSFVDRRNGDIVTVETEIATPMSFMADWMNQYNSGQPFEVQKHSESISIDIDWKD